ncbi:4'-phosphopantetheinyl transferase superfamily protein [Streptomyces sp. NBC_01210]|uniref:4'-phosphopantetheinyl transferase family protein n=1 Tax=Streptomyces sp. NBC_01210 TaxID=2903774 RepID=UPI002E14A347|nr:4'-phosphopantetheinyl transferase superfamily protein [Streptomyces sp. NBC_01210]
MLSAVVRADTVHVWQLDLDAATARAGSRLRAALSEEERSRSVRITDPVLRSRFETARAAARRVLGRYLAEDAARLIWRTGRWGKPYIAGHESALRFSLSHSGGVALLAVTGPRDIGVDLDRPREGRDFLALSRRFFTADESALVAAAPAADRAGVFLSMWTRKEACTKAAGTHMLGRGLGFSVSGAPGASGAVRAYDPSGGVAGDWAVRDVPAPPGYRAALALHGTAPAHMTVRQWEPQ